MKQFDKDDLIVSKKVAYLAGELSERDTILLSYELPSSEWCGLLAEKRRRDMAPILADLKEKFPEASTVYLKNGSPKLTVEWNRDDGIISVVWFDGGEARRDSFHPDALTTEAV